MEKSWVVLISTDEHVNATCVLTDEILYLVKRIVNKCFYHLLKIDHKFVNYLLNCSLFQCKHIYIVYHMFILSTLKHSH